MSQSKVPYNGTVAEGGDPLRQDLNVFYEVSVSQLYKNHAADMA